MNTEFKDRMTFDNSKLISRDKLSESKIFSKKCLTSDNVHIQTLEDMKELYSKLKDIEYDTDDIFNNFYPNIFIIGGDGSGKSSLIEHLTGIDIFPFNFRSGKVNIYFI
jgi:hypothetical protein